MSTNAEDTDPDTVLPGIIASFDIGGEDDEGIELTDDGGAIVRVEDEEEAKEAGKFYDNIVEQFEEQKLDNISMELTEAIERDKKAREQRDKDYAEATKRTGLGKEAPGGATFDGASTVVHPMLLMACMDFASRSIRELMPPNGPVKMYVPGDNVDPERLAKAERKKTFMNWQCIVQMPEFRSELEQLLTQLPLGGAMYLRLTPDFSKRRRRPVPQFVPLDFVTIPSSASNFYTAERQCYWEHVTTEEFEERVREGMYRDIRTAPPAMLPDETEAEKAAKKVEGNKPEPDNADGLKIVYEVSVNLDLEEGVGIAPYLVSIDQPSDKIVSIVRNWEEKDEFLDRMQWMVEWIFFPWRGAQGVGLGQAIGSLAGAATGALRALLDSAHIQNIPTLARLKGANFSGQSKTVNATQVVEIEGGVAGEGDIRKLLMPIPFNGPNETLFKLLGFLTDTGNQALHIALDKLAEDNSNLPVGTTLALIEEGMKVMSAIHLRLFHSMTYVIRILHRIDRMYLTEDELKNDVGEVLAKRADFEGPLDCIPTADPEIFSDVQRIAQAQIVADRAAAMPQVYDVRAVELMLLERAKIPNPESLLIAQPKPTEMNQVNENVAMTLGRPVTAFPEQDHLAHITVLVAFMESPLFGANSLIAPKFLPAALQHLVEHMVLWYANAYYELNRDALGANDDDMKHIMKHRDVETRKEMDLNLAASTKLVMKRANGVLKDLPPIIQKAQQMVQQYNQAAQSIPTDPNKAAANQTKLQVESMRDQRERDRMQQGDKHKVIDLQSEREARQADTVVEFAKLSASERQVALQEAHENARQANELAARLEELAAQERAEDERADAELQSEERRNTLDNETAARIAIAEIESSEKVDVSTGTGNNPNPSGSRKR